VSVAPADAFARAGELTGAERQALLRAARESIAAATAIRATVSRSGRSERIRPTQPRSSPSPPCRVTKAPRCSARAPVGAGSAGRRAWKCAAIEDGRFEPVAEAELHQLSIEVSALSPLEPIRPEDVEVGRHGLLIGHGGRRGVLLPQVPQEQGWDRETFLVHTCRKAGLPDDAWKKPGAEILGFTADVFRE